MISADELLKNSTKILEWLMERQEQGYGTTLGELHNKWIDYVDNQPTAYDIDGVVEQLKRCYGIVRSTSVDYAEGLKDAYERAIGIVKGGGIDGR